MADKSRITDVIITPHDGWRSMGFQDVLRARHMIWNLVRRDALLPYVDLAFGVAWTILRPLVFIAVFVFLKHNTGAVMGEKIDYVLFLLPSLALWWYFVDAVKQSGNSVFSGKALLSKIYFPRIITPAVPVLARLLDFSAHLLLVPIGMLHYAQMPSSLIVLVPLVVVHVMVLALGIGLIVSSLSAVLRDVGRVVDYILYVAFFFSPVIYSAGIITNPDTRFLYLVLNPMAAPLEMLRAALYEGIAPVWTEWGLSFALALAVLAIGIRLFWGLERILMERVL